MLKFHSPNHVHSKKRLIWNVGWYTHILVHWYNGILVHWYTDILIYWPNCEKPIFCIISRSEEAIRVGGLERQNSSLMTNSAVINIIIIIITKVNNHWLTVIKMIFFDHATIKYILMDCIPMFVWALVIELFSWFCGRSWPFCHHPSGVRKKVSQGSGVGMFGAG